MPKATKNSEPSWFGFPITLDPNHPVNREELLKFLDERKIGTRLMFAGNILGSRLIQKQILELLETLQILML